MKAAVITRHGGPEVIEVREVADPAAADGEVVVEVRAAALNHLDIWVRKGGRAKLTMPHALGSDASGVISSVGPGVERLREGDEVVINPGLSCGQCEFCLGGQQSLCSDFGIVGMARAGTFAKYVAVPAANVAPKPAHLDFVGSAGLTLAHLTAWRMLMTKGRCGPGQTVLIHGIGGGVATAALQLAKLASAVVIVTSSSDDKLAKAGRLRADHKINYGTQDVAGAVRDITAGRGVDLVIDTVGASTLAASVACARRGGRIVTCGVTSGATAEINLQAVYWNQIELLGSTLGSHEDFRQMLSAVSAGGIKPVIDSTYPLDQARQAAERMESAGQMGKTVLEIT